jgi:hypothetical protein
MFWYGTEFVICRVGKFLGQYNMSFVSMLFFNYAISGILREFVSQC